jgi:hypothetical protein
MIHLTDGEREILAEIAAEANIPDVDVCIHCRREIENGDGVLDDHGDAICWPCYEWFGDTEEVGAYRDLMDDLRLDEAMDAWLRQHMETDGGGDPPF